MGGDIERHETFAQTWVTDQQHELSEGNPFRPQPLNFLRLNCARIEHLQTYDRQLNRARLLDEGGPLGLEAARIAEHLEVQFVRILDLGLYHFDERDRAVKF